MRLTAELVIRDRGQSFFSGHGEFFIPGLGRLAGIDPNRVAEIVVDSMEEMFQVAHATVPVRTGKLQASLRLESFIEGSIAGGKLIAGDETVDYAKYVEAGPHPRPFIRPAYESTVGTAEKLAIEGIRTYIRGIL